MRSENNAGDAAAGVAVVTGGAVGYGTHKVLKNISSDKKTVDRARKMLKKEFSGTEDAIRKYNPKIKKVITERDDLGAKIKKRFGDKVSIDRKGSIFIPDSFKVDGKTMGDMTRRTKAIQDKKDLIGTLGRHKGKAGLAMGVLGGLGAGYLAYKGFN